MCVTWQESKKAFHQDANLAAGAVMQQQLRHDTVDIAQYVKEWQGQSWLDEGWQTLLDRHHSKAFIV